MASQQSLTEPIKERFSCRDVSLLTLAAFVFPSYEMLGRLVYFQASFLSGHVGCCNFSAAGCDESSVPLRFTECRSLDGCRTGQGDGAAASSLVTFTASDGAQFGGEGVKGRILVGVCWKGGWVRDTNPHF